ncbi:CLUMA_CG000720, isoform A [Clunio marinus]|uniref:CLUMA_CG000720, isoform A n=1 Tax=Clunio marinus TaxID=568069 RepID=A0A1J1HH65_9DIPT|nr:CLUMA_CG000720, isoform A [Clunio marinus]
MYLAYERFDLINTCIERNFKTQEDKEDGIITVRKNQSNDTLKVILKLGELHDKLVDFIMIINSLFSILLINLFGNIFLSNVLSLFAMYRIFFGHDQENYYNGMIQFLWNVYFMTLTICFIALCSLMTRTGKSTAVLVHKAINYIDNDNDPIIFYLKMFSQQMFDSDINGSEGTNLINNNKTSNNMTLLAMPAGILLVINIASRVFNNVNTRVKAETHTICYTLQTLPKKNALIVSETTDISIRRNNSFHNMFTAPAKSDIDKDSIEMLSSRLFQYKKPFDLTKISGISESCRRDFTHYLDSLQKFEFWALKMYDANGEISFGILSGNVNMYGDFEECLNIYEESLHFRGKHCFVELQPFVLKSAVYLNYLRRLAQSYDLMQTNFNDPPHVFGRFQSVTHGICVPSSCSYHDVEISMRFILNVFTNNTGLRFETNVKEEMCHVKKINEYKQITFDEWMTIFSVTHNWRELTTTNRSSEDINTIHGIRFLNAIMIFLCHKSVDGLMPRVNRTQMAINSAKSSSVLIRMCALYTDVFLMLSGTLVAYSMSKKVMRGQKIRIFREYIGRYIRIMPNIVTTMLITANIIPLFTNHGPQSFALVKTPAELCKKYWWRNLLMIHNWFKFEDMCNVHTHHVGSDFELFLIAPFLVILLWRRGKFGTYFVLSLCLVSAIARFYVTYNKKLMYFIPFGAKLSTLFETANHLYSLPTHRFSVYGIGLLLGFILIRFKDFKLSKLAFVIGQTISTILLMSVLVCGILMTGIDLEYNVMLHSFYAAFAPIFYCLCACWTIFAAQKDYKNFIIRLLEWKGFIITTKFCYAFYLIQIPLFQLSLANTKDIHYHNLSSIINLNEISKLSMKFILHPTYLIVLWQLSLFSLYRVFFGNDHKNFYNAIIQSSWTFTVALYLLGFISISSLMTRTGKYSAVLTHKAINFIEDDDDPIIFYLHRSPTISCGLFVVDFSLLFTILGATTTYCVILIQFDSGVPMNGLGSNHTFNETSNDFYNISSLK